MSSICMSVCPSVQILELIVYSKQIYLHNLERKRNVKINPLENFYIELDNCCGSCIVQFCSL